MEVSVSIAVAWSQSRGGCAQDAALSSALFEAQADTRLHQQQCQHRTWHSATGAHCCSRQQTQNPPPTTKYHDMVQFTTAFDICECVMSKLIVYLEGLSKDRVARLYCCRCLPTRLSCDCQRIVCSIFGTRQKVIECCQMEQQPCTLRWDI